MPPIQTYKLLLVEDNPGDALLVEERLFGVAEFHCELRHVTTLAEALAAVTAEPFNAIVLDLNLPDSTGLDTLRRLRTANTAAAIVVLSGSADEDLRRQVLREGAQVFLNKNESGSSLLARCVLYALERHRVQAQHQQLQRLVSSNPDAVIVTDPEWVVRYVNDAALALFGRQREAFVGDRLAFAVPEGESAEVEILRHGEQRVGEMRVVHFEWRGEPANLATIRDVTERRRAEAELERQRRLLRSILDSLGDGVAVVDENGLYLEFNPAAARILRRQAPIPEPEQRPGGYGFFHADGVTPYTHADLPLTRAVAGEASELEMVVKRPDLPGPVWLSVTASPLRDEAGGRRGGVVVFRDSTETKRITAERDRLLARLRLQIARMPIGYLLCDADFRFTAWNPAAERMFGYTEAEVIGRHPFDVIVPDEDQPEVQAVYDRLRAGHAEAESLRQNLTKHGQIVRCEWSNTPLFDEDGTFTGVLFLVQDVTDRVKLEDELRQAQKMEAIGQLAGGVAHDFNNLLTVINGYSDIVREQLAPADPAAAMVDEIRQAGERSSSLTRQLLLFSRKEVVVPRRVGLNAVVQDTGKMLKRLIGEDVAIELALDSQADHVWADPGQIEQVLMNLAVNARDAMPTGGRLRIETADVELDGTGVRHRPDLTVGWYVVLTVADTGSGIPAEVRDKIFEPFFTTKGLGKGTGLGLAVVHGVVKQAGGRVEVESDVGVGTTFRVYLPRTAATETSDAVPTARAGHMPRGSETILLVEDEDTVRALARMILSMCGYTVIEAVNGTEALAIARSHVGPIQLVITDVVMPELGGRSLGEQVQAIHREAQVLYMSGYPDDAVIRHGILNNDVAFLQKPFNPGTFARKVRDVIDGGKELPTAVV